ncbi:MAG: HlyD family secretion protein [Bacilli bacterium]|nr:HlyD family secretion protein [Bacilli bacterium]
MKWFWRKKMVYTLILIIVIAGGGTYFYLNKSKPTAKASATETVTAVTKGEIKNSISGTAQFEPKNLQIISAPSDGTIKTMNLTKNMPVKSGDLLFEVSNPDIEVGLQKGLVNLQQLQKDYDDLNNQLNSLTTVAPISGKLTLGNNIDVASQVSKTTKIASISDLSSLKVTLPFLLEDAVQLHAGDAVDLTLDGFMLTKTGTVQSIGITPRADSKGGKVIDVNIIVTNDSTLDAGMKVNGSVTINGNVSQAQDQAALQYIKTSTVLANTSGIISTLNFKTGDMVKQGDIIDNVTSDTLKNDILNKKATIDQQQVTNDDLQEKVNNLKVKAPFDGVFSTDFVNQKTNILGAHSVGSPVLSATQFGGVASLDSMQLPIQVDELDLPSIKVGLKANVKVDSLTGQNFQGEVTQVSSVGTTTNGVTNYTAVLAVPNTKQALKNGMSATADILIQDKKDALLIPIEALQSKQGKRFVTLKKTDGTTVSQEITIGIRSKTQIEVLTGLKEGDKVVTPVIQRQGQTLTQAQIDALRKQFQQGGGGGGGGGQGGQGGDTQVFVRPRGNNG